MSILELKDISKRFGGVDALDRVSCGFEGEKIIALIGPNGAGKTSVFNLISGFIRPDRGTISFMGKEIHSLSPSHIAKSGIGRLFQDVRVFDKLTLKDNVLVAFKRGYSENPLAAIFNRQRLKKEYRDLMEKTMELLELVGIADKADTLAENLSYGQQKLLAIARLLAADANLLLLDEPTAGVNPQMVKVLLDVICKLREQGKTVIVIEHNMNVVVEIADWVYFMDKGQVVSFGLPQEILGDPEVKKTYIGL